MLVSFDAIHCTNKRIFRLTLSDGLCEGFKDGPEVGNTQPPTSLQASVHEVDVPPGGIG